MNPGFLPTIQKDSAMHKVNPLQVIDSLGEITRHRDRILIEKSLLKTLGELAPDQEFRLFKVLDHQDTKISLGLLAYSINGYVETSGFNVKHHELHTDIKQFVVNAIQRKAIEQVSNASGKIHQIIYPAMDQDNEVFAILLHVCGDKFKVETSRFVYSLLKVYTNYLLLLEDNQRDKLTQLLNRDTMDREITRILLRNNHLDAARQAGMQLRRQNDLFNYWLGILDIDHFKSVNDRFGHLFGDDVLILIARQMQEDINGEGDLLYRFGGEEFVIILQALSYDEARNTMEGLRNHIANHKFPQLNQVTVSIGMVQITNQTGSTEIIDQADQALYYAKEHGRNQVCCYEDLLERSLITPITQNTSVNEPEFF